MCHILHVDMDAFFAAIEQLDQPALRNRPVLVGADAPRGVVCAASYEARKFGCHSAQPVAVAKRQCPQAVIVPVRRDRYRDISDRVFAIWGDFTPLVEPLSIDEAFLDVSGSVRLFGQPEAIAQSIKSRIREELGLTASVGIAFNKFLAKLASGLDKPDGLTVIRRDNLDDVLLPLPVAKIWGIGPSSAKRLNKLSVKTIADLRNLPMEQLSRHFGALGKSFYRLARGCDERSVTPDHQAKSIGEENTFRQDIANINHVRQVLSNHVEQVARRLRRYDLCARRITIKLRYGDFHTITRSVTLKQPTHTTHLLWQASVGLFEHWACRSFQPIRLIGVTANALTRDQGQLGLFTNEYHQRLRRLDQMADRITSRFGKKSLYRGTSH